MVRMTVKDTYCDNRRKLIDNRRDIEVGTEVDIISLELDESCYSKVKANCIIYLNPHYGLYYKSDMCFGLLLEYRSIGDYQLPETRRILRTVKRDLKNGKDPLINLKINQTSKKFGI